MAKTSIATSTVIRFAKYATAMTRMKRRNAGVSFLLNKAWTFGHDGKLAQIPIA